MADRFIDEYLHPCVPGYPVYASPRFSTEIIVMDGGNEQANQNWANPLHKYTLPEAVRAMEVFNAIRRHWLIMRGPAKAWPFRDPLDFATVDLEAPNVEPTTTKLDQVIGTGNGILKDFQLIKVYEVGAETFTRTIFLPVLSSIKLAVDGVLQTSGFTISRPGGVVSFTNPVPAGKLVTWGGLFDVQVRFEADDSFDGIVKTFGIGGFSDITLLEVRGC